MLQLALVPKHGITLSLRVMAVDITLSHDFVVSVHLLSHKVISFALATLALRF